MFDTQSTTEGGGIAGSIKRLLESTSEFLASKLDLISVELQEEKQRILHLLILAAAALLFGVLALTALTFTIVAIFWDTYRIPSLIIVTLGYLLISAALFIRLRRKVSLAANVFETTTEELKKDTQWVRRHL